MKIQPPTIERPPSSHGTARKLPASQVTKSPSSTPPTASTYTLPPADTENELQKALSTAVGNYMEKLRRKPEPAPRQADAMDGIRKDMLKARIDMLRKMMALAGSDPGSLRALAQQLSQAARELKSISGSGSTAGAAMTPQVSGTPASAEGPQQEMATEGADAAPTHSESATVSTVHATPDSQTQTGQQEGEQQDNKTGNTASNSGLVQEKASSEEEDPAIRKMLTELKQIRDWLKQKLRGSSDPQAKQSLKDVDMVLAAVEKNS
ncbi:hypothetical protein [Craterilacuibacter sp.]|uniref:hypothetical protein n=1 Tax=Craterilacuibacter sp. TaxID=2870909 RepID=UPI003F2E5D38